ncbi:MAG TPA: serine/threonine protein kinase, partial [Myxococcales bacterium]|nr:serine/threonine protein kinase [Myxococcales bacterium]
MTSERFEIIRPLAKGGFGEVWLGVDHMDGDRRVVIKRLHEGVDTAILAREYDVLRELAHPHIAQVIDFQADDDLNPRLVEDFVDGPDLAEACIGLSYVERGRLLAQVLRALDYVHARGVVHGDIKPSNVLVQRNGDTLSARVIDFGLAKRSDEATLSVSGTPAYMAPELISGKTANAQCDLYAFGVMAYRIFTGQLPFSGMPLSELCQAHMEKLATLPTEVKADLPASLNPVLMRLLEKKPEDR